MIDFGTLTFTGLITLGFVNVLTFFFPLMDSKIKFSSSVVVAFALTFVPVELGMVLFDKIKTALETAFAVSGLYKLSTKIGGN